MTMIKVRFRRSSTPEVRSLIRPVFEDFHRLRMAGTYEYPRHQHTNYEVILIERGPYRCELNGQQLGLKEGQVLVVKPGDWHQDHLRDGQRHYVLHFRLVTGFPGESVVPLFHSDVRSVNQICRGNYMRETIFIRELQREAEEGAPHAPAVQDSLLEVLFWRIARGLPEESLSAAFRQLPLAESQREKLGAIFQRHVKSNPTVVELAAEAKMSPRHFTVISTQLFGTSPARFLLGLKMRRAEEMLRFREQSVKEVSVALGFANPYHFSRTFKRVYGRPPSQC